MMATKRKFQPVSVQENVLLSEIGENITFNKDFDEEGDSTDEELSDSNFDDDDGDVDLQGLDLDSDGENNDDDYEPKENDTDSDNSESDEYESACDEWEDVDSDEHEDNNDEPEDVDSLEPEDIDSDEDVNNDEPEDVDSDEPEDVDSDEPEDVDSDEPEDIDSDEHEDDDSDEPEDDSAYASCSKEDDKDDSSSNTEKKSSKKLTKTSRKGKSKLKAIKNKKSHNLHNSIEKDSEIQSSTSKSDKNSKAEIVPSQSSTNTELDGLSTEKVDEYEEDSSDEEDLRNTVGNIPINWYDEYDHVGYGLDSLPIMKPKKGDSLDQFLEKMENPDYDRTVFDKQTWQEVRLSDRQLDMVQRLMNYKVPNADYDMYAPFPDLYSHEVMQMPLSGRNEHKRSFLPSKHERQKVVRLAMMIRQGFFRRKNPRWEKEKKKNPYYDIWKPRSEDEPKIRRVKDHIPAPKMKTPGDSLSYNPPPEYLVTKHDTDVLKGKKKGTPFRSLKKKYKSVRVIPSYPKYIVERYERLMDLYLAPRKKYKKLNAQSKDFLPKLPDRRDLRPYPTLEGLIFKGHQSIIRTISVHPLAKYLASGSDDHTVRIWETSTGRCLRVFEVEDAVKKVAWNPNPKLFLLGVALGTRVVLLSPETYLTDKIVVQQTNAIFKEEVAQGDYIAPKRVTDAVTWRKATPEEWAKGYRVVLDHFKEVKEIIWHRQGDYFATVLPEGNFRSVLMHQLSRWRSQQPFTKNRGRVQTVAFHPKKPQLFVVTQSHIRIYELTRQLLLKKVQANSRWCSSIAVHPGGEHFIVTGYDRRVNWFEMECTKRPHLMRYHAAAIRAVAFHRKYPLFATCSDDKRIVVTHGMVYDDYVKDPLIVPLKSLGGHMKFDDLHVLDLAWHPYEPYLFSAGADATIRLWH